MTTPKTRRTILLPEKEVSAALDMLTDNSIGPAEVITLTEESEQSWPLTEESEPSKRSRWVTGWFMTSIGEVSDDS